jgi:hypothetical protein
MMDEAVRAGLRARLKVTDTNDPSIRLYLHLRLGFVVATNRSIDMDWRMPNSSFPR